jgi:hypothetical protein
MIKNIKKKQKTMIKKIKKRQKDKLRSRLSKKYYINKELTKLEKSWKVKKIN